MKDAPGLAVDAAGGAGPRSSGFTCEALDMKRLLNVIADQIADADRRHSQVLVEMQDRLGVLGQVAQDLRGQLPDAMTPALDRIESSMATLTSRIAEAEPQPAHAASAGRGEGQSHFSSVDVAEAGQGPAPLRSAMPADALGIYSRRDGMANVDRFDVVDSDFRPLGDEPWDEASAEALTRIYEDDSARLAAMAGTHAGAAGRAGHDIDRAARDAAGEHQADVEAWHQPGATGTFLSTQDGGRAGAASSGGDPYAAQSRLEMGLEERLAEIAARLERTLAGLDPSGPVNQIQARVQSLEECIVKAMTGAVTRADLSSLKSIESQVEDLTARFDTVQTHFSRLDTIELELRALAERISEDRLVKMLGRPEQSAADGDRLAHAVSAKFAEHMPTIEDALRTIADRVSRENLAQMMAKPAQPDIAQVARMVAEQVARSLPKAERQESGLELKRIDELSALLQSYVTEKRHGDEQTSAMLDTMQQAMIRLLDRMDAIESMSVADYEEGGPLPAEPAEVALPDERFGPYAVDDHGQPERSNDTHRFDADPQLPDPLPMVHGATDRGGVRPGAGETAASVDSGEASYIPNQRFRTEAEGDAGPVKQGGPANREDFIAAARRAARQAAAAPAEPNEDEAESSGGAKRKPAKTEKGETKKRSLSIVTVALVCLVIAGASFSIFKSTILSSKPEAVTPPVPAAAPAGTKDKRLKNLEDADVIIEDKSEAPGRGEGKAARPDDRRSEVSPDAGGRSARAADAGSVRDGSGDFTTAFDGAAQRAVTANEALQGGLPPARSEFVRQYASAEGGPVPDDAASHRVPAALTKDTDGAATHRPAQAPMPPLTIGPLSLRSAAAKGDASAQFEIGVRFAEGKGVIQDLKQSVAWYQRSAAQGFAPAQYRLASMYERGLGIDQDLQRAKVWYQRAAEQGIVKAMHNLAVLSAGRDSGTPDYAFAGKWFILAAEHGLTDSQFNLAIMYDSGLGVERDAKAAFKWFSLAARTGDAEASRRRVSLKSKLTPVELKSVEEEIASWQPRKSDEAINDPRQAGSMWMRRAN